MKNILMGICLISMLLLTAFSGNSGSMSGGIRSAGTETQSMAAGDDSIPAVNLAVGGEIFAVKLYDNAAARELAGRMPLELDMSELHGNEKYNYLPKALPTDTQSVGEVHTGDLMLYGSDCLVLFYEDFQTPFDYTKLGYIENPEGLAEIVGTGSVTITFANIRKDTVNVKGDHTGIPDR